MCLKSEGLNRQQEKKQSLDKGGCSSQNTSMYHVHLTGAEILHDLGNVHRDIKLSNMLVSSRISSNLFTLSTLKELSLFYSFKNDNFLHIRRLKS